MLAARVITGLVLGIAITAAILFLPTPYAAATLALMWLAGGWEWAGLGRARDGGRWLYVAGLLVLMLLAAFLPPTDGGIDVLVAIAVVAWCVALAGIVTFPRPIPSWCVLAAGPVALLPSLILLGFVHATVPLGPKLTLLALALVWAADIGAYAVGRLLGRVKLAPKVSPGKTWEGVIGGVAFAALTAWIGSRLLDLPTAALIAIGVCTALVSVVGDLTVSMLKRSVGLKDSGRLLPGHGGVMDRIDGLIAAVPVYAAGLRLAGLLA